MTKSANRKVAARKARSAHSKSSKRSTEARNKNQKTPRKIAAKLRDSVAAETVRDTHRIIDAQYDQFRRGGATGGKKMADIQKLGEEFQRASKDGFDASVRSFGEVSKGFQAIGTTIVD